jgi:hypothetical protein
MIPLTADQPFNARHGTFVDRCALMRAARVRFASAWRRTLFKSVFIQLLSTPQSSG